MTSFDNLMSRSVAFGSDIEMYLETLGILNTARSLEADHMGLRLKNHEDVKRVKEELCAEATLLSSAIVNGREICIFELAQPLHIASWNVACVELPFPKANHPYEDGLEHIEFVIPSRASTLDEMRNSFKGMFPSLDIESLTESGEYSEALPSAESDQLPNPSIELTKRTGLTIKFHPASIKSVVTSQ